MAFEVIHVCKCQKFYNVIISTFRYAMISIKNKKLGWIKNRKLGWSTKYPQMAALVPMYAHLQSSDIFNQGEDSIIWFNYSYNNSKTLIFTLDSNITLKENVHIDIIYDGTPKWVQMSALTCLKFKVIGNVCLLLFFRHWNYTGYVETFI